MSNKWTTACVITVQGVLQRVGVRRYAEALARRHRLTGHVQNSIDVTVKFFLQGEQQELDKLAEEIRSAPAPIEVDRIVVRKEAGYLDQKLQDKIWAISRRDTGGVRRHAE